MGVFSSSGASTSSGGSSWTPQLISSFNKLYHYLDLMTNNIIIYIYIVDSDWRIFLVGFLINLETVDYHFRRALYRGSHLAYATTTGAYAGLRSEKKLPIQPLRASFLCKTSCAASFRKTIFESLQLIRGIQNVCPKLFKLDFGAQSAQSS